MKKVYVSILSILMLFLLLGSALATDGDSSPDSLIIFSDDQEYNKEKATNDVMIDRISDLLLMEKYSATTWKEASVSEREDMLKGFHEELNRVFGTDTEITIEKTSDDVADYGSYRYKFMYFFEVDEMTVNSISIADDNSWAEIIKTVIHEMRHAYQYYVINDPDAYFVNEEEWKDWKWNTKPWNIKDPSAFWVSQEDYENQPIEKDAFDFEEIVYNQYLNKNREKVQEAYRVKITPKNLTPERIESNSITMSWDGIDYEELAVDFAYLIRGAGIVAWTKDTKYSFPGLTPNTIYSFEVAAVDLSDGTTSNWSSAVEVKTESDVASIPIKSPKNLRHSSTKSTSITMSWDKVDGVERYEIKGAGTTKEITGTISTFYGLTPNRSYSFEVAAKNAEGEISEWSAARRVSTLRAMIPPTGLGSTSTTKDTITMSWNKVEGATKYKIKGAGKEEETTDLSYEFTGLTANTTYSFEVAAINAANEMSDWSAAKSVTTRRALEPPTGVEANNIASTTVTMSWDNVPGAVRYLFMGFGTAGAVNNPQAFTGLTPNTTYTFKVGAENAAGETSDWSAEKSFTTLRAMIPPTGLDSTSTTKDTITMSWNKVEGATKYKIKGAGKEEETTDLSYEFTGLTANTTYSFEVAAINAANEMSDWSAAKSVTTRRALEPPTGVEANNIASTTVTMSWDDVPGAVRYLFMGFGTAGAVNNPQAFTGLTPNTTYTFKVGAENAAGETSDWSAEKSFTTLRAMIPPTGLDSTSTTKDTITMSWNKVEGATKYKIKGAGKEEETTDLSYEFTGLTANTTYSFEVAAINAANEMSDWSAAKSVTTRRALEPPTGVEANNIASTTVTMSWDDVPGAVRYLFMGFGTAGAVNNPQAFTGLTPNTTYTFKVGAENAAGETSDWSAEKSFTTLRAMIPPTGLGSTSTTKDTITMSWNKVEGATKYKIKGAGKEEETTDLSYEFTGLTANTTYSFEVAAINAANEMSDWSAAKSVTTRRALEPPTGVEANNIASTTVTMSWDDVPGAVRYLFMGFGTAGAVNNPQAFTGLTPNTTYTFKVGAENAAGETSDWSAEKSFTTLRAMIPPTGLDSTSTTKDTITMSWNKVEGATKYKIKVCGQGRRDDGSILRVYRADGEHNVQL